MLSSLLPLCVCVCVSLSLPTPPPPPPSLSLSHTHTHNTDTLHKYCMTSIVSCIIHVLRHVQCQWFTSMSYLILVLSLGSLYIATDDHWLPTYWMHFSCILSFRSRTSPMLVNWLFRMAHSSSVMSASFITPSEFLCLVRFSSFNIFISFTSQLTHHHTSPPFPHTHSLSIYPSFSPLSVCLSFFLSITLPTWSVITAFVNYWVYSLSNRKPILKNISFRVDPGQTVALVCWKWKSIKCS